MRVVRGNQCSFWPPLISNLNLQKSVTFSLYNRGLKLEVTRESHENQSKVSRAALKMKNKLFWILRQKSMYLKKIFQMAWYFFKKRSKFFLMSASRMRPAGLRPLFYINEYYLHRQSTFHAMKIDNGIFSLPRGQNIIEIDNFFYTWKQI